MYKLYNIDVRFDFPFDFNQEKNLLLKETRKVSFEDVIEAVGKGKTLDNLVHGNKKRYPNQKILIVNINNYTYTVPYIIDSKRKVIFLKTLYPSRKLTKKYIEKGVTKDEKK